METNYTLKNLIRGGTLLLFFLAFMLTGPQSAEAQEVEPLSVPAELVLEVEGPKGSGVILYTGPGSAGTTYRVPTTTVGNVSRTWTITGFSEGTDVYFEILPLTVGQVTFTGWVDIDDGTPIEPAIFFDYQYTFPEDGAGTYKIKALFEAATYTVTATVDGAGTEEGEPNVTDDGNVAYIGEVGTVTQSVEDWNSLVTVEATATPTWTFVEWKFTPTPTFKDGYGIYDAKTTFILPQQEVEAKAVFGKNYTLALEAGTGTPTMSSTPSPGTVYETQEITVVAVGDLGWTFDNWDNEFAGKSTWSAANGGVATLTFDVPASNVTVTANYEQFFASVDVAALGANGGVASNTVSIEYPVTSGSTATTTAVTAGDEYQLSFKLEDGWTFEEWRDNSTPQNVVKTPTFTWTMVDSNADWTAIFAKEFKLVGIATQTVSGATNFGSITFDKPEDVAEGTDVVYTVDAPLGWSIQSIVSEGLTGGDVISLNDVAGGIKTGTFTMPGGNVTITATFTQYELATVVNPASSGTIAQDVSNGPVTHGTEIKLTATAEEGYVFENWTHVGENPSFADNTNNPITFDMPTGTLTVTANFVGGQTLTFTADEGGEIIVPDTDSPKWYDLNEEVVIVAQADAGWTFNNFVAVGTKSGTFDSSDNDVVWDGGRIATLTFDITQATTVTATFVRYEVVGLVDPVEAAEFSFESFAGTSAYVTAGETVTITATPRADFGPQNNEVAYRFVNWTEDGAAIAFNPDDEQITNFEMLTGSVTVTANYEKLNELVLQQPAEGGSIGILTETYFYEEVEIMVLTAEAEDGWTFDSWDISSTDLAVPDTERTPDGGVATLTWHNDIAGVATVTANFVQYTYAVFSADTDKGTVEPVAVTPLREGRVGVATATAVTGWTFNGWAFDGVASINTPGSGEKVGVATFTMPAGNVTLTANWTNYILTTAVDGNVGGTIEPPTGRQTAGEVVEVTATADTGYTFVKFEVDAQNFDINDLNVTDELSKVGTATFTMPTENVTIRAIFEQYFLTVELVPEDKGNRVRIDEVDDYVETFQIPVTIGEDIQLRAIPVPLEYQFRDWSGNVVGVATPTNEIIDYTMPGPGSTIIATFDKLYNLDLATIGGGTLKLIPNQNQNQNQNQFIEGEQVVLRAEANEGWTFDEWAPPSPPFGTSEEWDEANGGVATLTFDMPNEATTVTATFVQHDLVIKDPGNGNNTFPMSHSIGDPITSGEQVVLRAQANIGEGWTFDNFVVDPVSALFEQGGNDSGVGTATLTMPASTVTVTTIFKQYTVAVKTEPVGAAVVYLNDEEGPVVEAITLNSDIPYTVKLGAINEGYNFEGWTFDGITDGTATDTFKFTEIMTSGTVTWTANFSKKDYPLTIAQMGDGTVTPGVGTASYTYKDPITVVAEADQPDWMFGEWVLDGIDEIEDDVNIVENGAVSTITFRMPNNPATVTAQFRPATVVYIVGNQHICIEAGDNTESITYRYDIESEIHADPATYFDSFQWEIHGGYFRDNTDVASAARVRWNLLEDENLIEEAWLRVTVFKDDEALYVSEKFYVNQYVEIEGVDLIVDEPAICLGDQTEITVNAIHPIGAQNGVFSGEDYAVSTMTYAGVGNVTITTTDGITFTVEADAPGTYTLTYRAENGSCEFEKEVGFVVKDYIDDISLTPGPIATLCFDDEFVFEATPVFVNEEVDLTYDWTVYPAGAGVVIDENELTFTAVGVDTPTQYVITVTATDECGKYATASSTLTVNPTPLFDGIVVSGLCFDADVIAQLDNPQHIIGAFSPTYTWELTGDGVGLETSTIANFGELAPGTYTVTVTVGHEAFACETTYAVGFTVIPEPVIYFAFDGTVITTGETIDVCYDNVALFTINNAVGQQPFNVTYTVNGGAGEDILVDDTTEKTVADLVGGMEPGTYDIELTSIVDADGCAVNNPEDFYNFTIEIHPEPVLIFAFAGDEIEPGETIPVCYNSTEEFSLLDAVGTYPFIIEYQVGTDTQTYTETVATSTWTKTITDLIGDPLVPGDYLITLTSIVDGGVIGCPVDTPTSTYTFTISVKEEPAVGFAFNGRLADTGDVFDDYCFNETVTVTLAEVWYGDAPFAIEWTVNGVVGTATGVYEGGVLFTDPLDAGSYDIQVTSIVDANGCEPSTYAPYFAQVVVHPEPVAEIAGPTFVCYDLAIDLYLDVADPNTLGSNYEVTWEIESNGTVTSIVVIDDLGFEFDGAIFGVSDETTYHTVTAHVVNEWGCESVTDQFIVTVGQTPTIVNNVIQLPKVDGQVAYIFADFIPAEEVLISGVGQPVIKDNAEHDICDNIELRWQFREYENDAWGPWQFVVPSNVINYRLPEHMNTVQYRRMARGLDCWCPNPDNPNNTPWFPSNVVTVYVVEQTVTATATPEEVCLGESIEIVGNMPALVEYDDYGDLTGETIPYATGSWTAVDGIEFSDDLTEPVQTISAEVYGDYTLTWTLVPMPFVVGLDPSFEAEVEVTFFEEPMISFAFNDVEAGHNAEFEYCHTEPVTVTLHQIYAGVAPFDVTYVINGGPEVTVPGLNVGDPIFGGVMAAGFYEIEVVNIVDGNGCEANDDFLALLTADVTLQDVELDVVVTNFGMDEYFCKGADAIDIVLPDIIPTPLDIEYEAVLTLNGDVFTADEFDPALAGTYEFVYTVTTSAGCVAVAEAMVTVLDVPAAPATTPVEVVYDGTAKEFDVADAPTGYVLVHKLDADDPWTYGVLPTYTEPGAYTVYVAYERIAAPNCLSEVSVAELNILPPDPLDFSEIDDIAVTGKTAYITWTDGDMDAWEYRLDGGAWVATTNTSVFFDNLDFATEYTFELKMEGYFNTFTIVSDTFTTMYRGDVNKDDVVNILDITTRIIPYINNTLPATVDIIGDASDYTDNLNVFVWDAADVNNDSIINVQDIVITVNIALAFDPGKTTSNDADVYMNNNVVQIDSDGTLAGIQFELKGHNLNEAEIVLIPEGYQVTWSVEGNTLTGLIFSFNNKPFSEGVMDLFRIEGVQGVEWGEVYAANLAGDRVDVTTHDGSTDVFDPDTDIVSLDVYPNPSNGQFTSRFNVPQNSMVELRLYDLSGRQVAVRQVEAGGAADLSWELDLQPGMYILRMAATPEGRPELSVTREVRVLIN